MQNNSQSSNIFNQQTWFSTADTAEDISDGGGSGEGKTFSTEITLIEKNFVFNNTLPIRMDTRSFNSVPCISLSLLNNVETCPLFYTELVIMLQNIKSSYKLSWPFALSFHVKIQFGTVFQNIWNLIINIQVI